MSNCGAALCCTPAPDRRFEFQKSSQLLIGVHNETLSVVPVCVNNPDRSPFAVYRSDTSPTSSCFAAIVSDYLPGSFWLFYPLKQKSREGSLSTLTHG
jgi:hypothetical protein